MSSSLPAVPDLDIIKSRLPEIFPEGTPNRNYVIREMSAKTIFVMFYVGAIEGTDRWIRPSQVTSMTDVQAGKTSAGERETWTTHSLKQKKDNDIIGRWYAGDTREPIRDETLRFGLIQTGAVIEKPGVPTTSSKPRYALKKDFAGLFENGLSPEELLLRISEWQEKHLNAGALARIKLLKKGLASSQDDFVLVNLPNGESRRMSSGPSSVLSKSVIEVFAKNFLINPALIFLSESSNKVVVQDNEVAKSVGLEIKADRNLPDIILADLGTQHPLLVFVEVVFSDGPVSETRKSALLEIALNAGFKEKQVVFVSAFEDRASGAFKKASSELAWGSFAWFMSEPENMLIYKDSETLENKALFEIIK